MPTLRESQMEMAQSLLFGGTDAFELIIEDPERLDIYRNTVESVLIGALRITYPIVDKLVGAAFFDATALAFARTSPPAVGCLNDWGGEFPVFLETFDPAASLAYLPDVARLEWAISCAMNAPDVPILLPQNATLPLLRHPSFSLVAINWPVMEIRQAVLDDDFSSLKLSPGPRWLAISRYGEDILMRPLSEEAASFTRLLLTNAHFTVDENPELVKVLADHFSCGCFQEVST
jgi:hypothetical protein